jgi:outer membrane lipoprotein SlyB
MRPGLASTLLSSALLTACASSTPDSRMLASTQGTTLVRSGQVMEVRDVAIQGGRTSGLGSVVGAVLGGLAGSAVGGGNGSTVASIGGALAGGVAGQQVEQSGNQRRMIDVSVRFDNGDVRNYRIESDQPVRVGDTVTISTGPEGTRIVRQ